MEVFKVKLTTSVNTLLDFGHLQITHASAFAVVITKLMLSSEPGYNTKSTVSYVALDIA